MSMSSTGQTHLAGKVVCVGSDGKQQVQAQVLSEKVSQWME